MKKISGAVFKRTIIFPSHSVYVAIYIYYVSIHLLNNIYFVTIYLDVHCVLGCFCHVLILRVGKPTDSEAMSTLALLEAM